MEKVEVVKRLIRSHNYGDIEKVYIRCLEYGIHVNKTALYRFSQKLSLLDKANRVSTRKVIDIPARGLESFQQHIEDSGPKVEPMLVQPQQVTAEPSLEVNATLPNSNNSKNNKANTNKTNNRNSAISFSEAKRREAEITFELGAMKIKEHALLEELNSLSKIIDEKH